MNFSDNFRENLRYLRKEHHLTQKEMAGILGVSPATVGRIESGTPVRLHSGHLMRVCDRFGYSADAMLRECLRDNTDVCYCTAER